MAKFAVGTLIAAVGRKGISAAASAVPTSNSPLPHSARRGNPAIHSAPPRDITDPPPPRFQLECGAVEGVWMPPMSAVPSAPPTPAVRVAGLLGVPYAKPPVGRDGRWRPPRAAQCWAGTFNATTQPTQCIQWKHVSVSPPMAPMSEDCLYLDVFTPAPKEGRTAAPHAADTTGVNSTSLGPTLGDTRPQDVGGASQPTSPLLPIFFWIYGGDNTMGSTSFYGPLQNLVTLYGGKAIVVAPNYRVGNFGFLTLKELSEADPRKASGNYGILDLQLALQWVQDNAVALGGDKSKVTLIGQSSGGTNIFALLASPASTSLFSAAISLSGSPNITIDLATAEAQDRQFVANVGCDSATDVLECLYALSATDVALRSPEGWDFGGASLPSKGSTPDSPPSRDGLVVVDGVTIPRPLLEALQAPVIDVPLIVQSMQAETDYAPKVEIANWTTADFDRFVASTFAGWPVSTAADIRAAYSSVAAQSGALAYYVLDADIGITCGTAAVAMAAASAPGRRHPVYLAQVTQRPSHPYPFLPAEPDLKFPFHMWDFIAGFGTWGLPYVVPGGYTPSAADLAFGAMVRTSWWQLASSGAVSAVPWVPLTNASAPVTAVINTRNPRAEAGWKAATCAMLRRAELGQRYWWVN